jgi:hypothetical protein
MHNKDFRANETAQQEHKIIIENQFHFYIWATDNQKVKSGIVFQ